MKKTVVCLLAALSLAAGDTSGASAEMRHRSFETKIIARGDNAPPLSLAEIHADQVLVLLTEGVSESEIRGHQFPDGVSAATALDALLEHGFVRRAEKGDLLPTVAVMTLEAVSTHMPVDAGVVDETVEAILAYAPKAFETIALLEGFSHLRRAQYDLLLLSNGLLDNFQIGKVEAQVIESPRPERAGGNYYLSIQEKSPSSSTEAFGIYGNSTGTYGRYILGVYGNKRTEHTNFNRMREKLFADNKLIDDATLRERRRQLVQALGAWWFGEEIAEDHRRVLQRLGFIDESGTIMIPVITTANYPTFNTLVTGFTPTLVRILRNHLPRLNDRYAESPFAEAVSFEEYFMWWFHLYYSAVTDALVGLGAVHLPPQGVSTYLMIPDSPP